MIGRFINGSRELHTFADCAWHDCPTHNSDRDPAYTPARQWPGGSNEPVLCGECLLVHRDEVSLKPDGSCNCCAGGHLAADRRGILDA